MTAAPSRGRTIATWIAIAVLGLLCAALGVRVGQMLEARSGPPLPDGVVVLEPGDPVPAILLTDLRSGVPAGLGTRGRVRLLNWWASWCRPCRDEMPVLDAFARSQGPDGVEVVGIALEDPADARAFLAQVPVGFALRFEPAGLADSSVRLGNRRGLLPFSALVGADGRLLKVHTGPFRDEAAVRAWAQPN